MRSGSCVESSLLPSTWSTLEPTRPFATWKSYHGARWEHTSRPFTPTKVHIQEAQWRYTTSGRGQLPTEKFPSPEPLHRCSVQDQLPPNSRRRGFCTHRPRLRCIQPRTSRESRADSPCAKSQTYLCVMYLACWTFPRQQRTRALADAAAACRFASRLPPLTSTVVLAVFVSAGRTTISQKCCLAPGNMVLQGVILSPRHPMPFRSPGTQIVAVERVNHHSRKSLRQGP